MMNDRGRTMARFLLGLLAVYLAGVAIRRLVLEVQYAQHGADVPFTMESALHYRRVAQVMEQGALPERDPYVQYPDGVVVRETDTVGDEYVYARLARLFPKGVPLAARLRWIQPAWFCLGIPLMAFWVWMWRRSSWGAFLAASFYAGSLSAVIRSTGQELSHENFAMPWLLAHFACGAAAAAASGRARLWNALSAISLGVALMTWDMVQFYVTLWMVVNAWRILRRADDAAEAEGGWAWHWWALVLVGLFNPYLRRHGFLLSPAMLLGYGVVLATVARRAARDGYCGERWGSRWAGWGLGLLPLAAGLAMPGAYGASYGHFAALLAAKLRYPGGKPLDPSLLTFDQRIMWVPALHSANLNLTFVLFPAILILSLMAALLLLCRKSDRSNSRILQLIFFYSVSLAAFALFVRFQVFLAVFAAALIGLWAGAMDQRRGFARRLALSLLTAGVLLEAWNVIARPLEWGRTGVYYKELRELTARLADGIAPDPVLANFGVSGGILAYGGCPIVLHPKFESPEIRSRVREYGEQLFKGTDRSFRDWSSRLGAEYYVYGLGEFSNIAPDRQMRYFVDALNPPEDCPARIFEFAPDKSPYFRFLWGNRKYRLFKILTHMDEELAAEYGAAARGALEHGDLDGAEYSATEALRLNPHNREAQQVLKHAGALRDQGFLQQGP